MKMYLKLFILSLVLAIPILILNFLFFKNTTLFFPINFIALILLFFPILLMKYIENLRRKWIEDKFSVFLRDLIEAVRGGLLLPQAFKAVSKNDYGILSTYVKKMSAQLEWGVPLEKVLLNFARETKSKLIGRVISTVIESHRAGGDLTDVLEALGRTAVEIERLRAERKLYLHSQVITGYVIFFVFLGVMIGLRRFLVPSLIEASLEAPSATAQPTEISQEYQSCFQHLIIIQAIFAGLIVGKMSEGHIVAGIKHVLIMITISIIVFIIFP